jgi:hypothetical protein
MDAVSAIVFENVECDRVFKIGWIEIDDIPASPWWQMVENFLGEVAMGIDETNAFAGRNVLQDQIAKKSALAHTTFTDQKQMLAPVRSTDAERACPAPDTPVTNMANAIRINHAPEPNPRPINLILLVKKMTSKSGNRCVFASRSGGWDWLWNASVSSPLFLNCNCTVSSAGRGA